MEIWKDIPGFEGSYEASTEGRIRSTSRVVATGRGGYRITEGAVLKPYKTRNGYLMLVLSCDHKKTKALVHRLVAKTFLEESPDKYTVNHKNLIKTDNRVQNLEWMTHAENQQHAHNNGAFPKGLNCKAVRCIPLGKEFDSSYQAAEWVNETQKQYSGNVTSLASNIRAAIRNKKFRYGYKWEHVENEPSTTIPKGSTPKWVEMGDPS